MLSKKGAQIFFFGGTIITFAVFLVMSFITMTQEVPKRTHEENLSPAVVAGKAIWEQNNCMGCHTILGEGGYYAPELTKVYDRLGENRIRQILKMKTPWQPNGRKMVAYGMSDEDANNMVEYFKWIGEIDLNGFPPKPKYEIIKND